MSTDTYSNLHDKGVFQYNSEKLNKFEGHLTKYFRREYARHKNKKAQSVIINKGPLALEAENLADDHYDEGLSFFNNFLDAETMSYTMAYFDDNPDRAMESSKTLEQAQLDKFSLIAERMKIVGNERLLNLGCGFGYFESFLLKKYPDIQISSLTHSKDQHEFITNRIKDSTDMLHSDRFSIFFGEIDDNCVSLLGGEIYDIVCSVGLVEQINNIKLFFEIISRLLVKNGRMFHHLIVSRDLIPQFLNPEKTLIGQYFPGGKVLPFKALNCDFQDFSIDKAWFINGNNYWKTLDKWHANFWRNMGKIYPENMGYERVRYWNNYFSLCKAMFSPENGLAYGNGQYLYYKQN